MFNFTFEGLEDVQDRIASMADAVRAAIEAKSQELAEALADKVNDKLSGEVLQSKTGRLRSSINSTVEANGDIISGSVFVDGDVPYAAIQEYGGQTKAHVIEAANAKALAFNWNGKASFFARVNHPGSAIPERSYMRSSLDDMNDDINAGLADAVNEAISD